MYLLLAIIWWIWGGFGLSHRENMAYDWIQHYTINVHANWKRPYDNLSNNQYVSYQLMYATSTNFDIECNEPISTQADWYYDPDRLQKYRIWMLDIKS